MKTPTTDKLALIIEDDFCINIMLESMLRLRNINTVSSFSLNQAKEILSQIVPDLVYIDHRLPDGWGFEFIPTLRGALPKAWIIAMTAQNINENKTMAISKGANYFLEKPFLINDVFQSLDDLVNQ